MPGQIVDWALKNRFLVIVLGMLLVAVGVDHMLRLPIDAVPDVTNVQVQVLTKAPALAPLEVERFITFPVEAAMAGLPNLEEIRSVSKFGLSAVTVVFTEGSDIYLARQLVQERLVEARETISQEYGTPELGPIATGLGEIYQGEAVVGVVMMLLGENSRQVAEDVKAKIDSIRGSLPPGVTIETFYDRTDLIQRTIRTVETNLLEGGILVVAVLLLMLGNVRGGLIVASAIPLSMLFAFIGMVSAGVSGNLMSLGAIDFGLIVDGSVVMIENVFRLMAETRNRDKSAVELVREATVEVARPVAFAVGIIMVVYLPVLTLTGVEGKMFRPMALTVIFALAGSLILALTLVPVLASLFLRKPPRQHETWLVRTLRRFYEPLLDRALHRPLAVVGAAALVFAAGVGLASTRGTEFIPELDEGAIALQVWRLPSVSVDEAARQSGTIEQLLLAEFPDEIDTVVSKTGRPEIATDPMGVEMSDVFVMLEPRDQWKLSSKAELIDKMEEVLNKNVPGVAFGFSQPIELRVSELISGVRSDVAIKIFGDDLEELLRLAEQVARTVSNVDGATDVKVEQVAGLPILTIKVDRASVARHGVSSDDVLAVVEALGGKQVGVILEGEKRFALQVRFPEEIRNEETAIARIPVAASRARLLPLGELATFDTEPSAAQVSRERIQRRITVEVNVRNVDIGTFVANAKDAITADVRLPAGYTLEWGGQFENLERASRRLAIVVPLALLLIFVLLYGTFGAFRPALLIFLNVPFAATGGIFALAARGMPFSIAAGVGFIALFGVAVLNGVVLIAYIRRLESERAMMPAEAAREGALTRMRPVLMTALVAALGFVPMALATGAGAEVQRPLATVVIGGLATSTLLTLFVLPVIYGWFTKTPEEEIS